MKCDIAVIFNNFHSVVVSFAQLFGADGRNILEASIFTVPVYIEIHNYYSRTSISTKVVNFDLNSALGCSEGGGCIHSARRILIVTD